MDAVFTLLSKGGKGLPQNALDWERYMLEHDGEELYVQIKPLAKTSEKMRMYAYLFGPLMSSAVNGYVYRGYHGIDRVQARYKLQAEFCKKELYNEITKETEITLEDLSGMNKKRLLQFVTDCVYYIEEHLCQKIPDSALYKMQQATGRPFKSVKFEDHG